MPQKSAPPSARIHDSITAFLTHLPRWVLTKQMALVLIVAILARIAAFGFLISPNGDGYSYGLEAEYFSKHFSLPPWDSGYHAASHHTSPVFAMVLGALTSVFRLMGAGADSLYVSSAVIGLCVVVVSFGIGFRLGDVRAAVFSALFSALLPMELVAEVSIYAEPLVAFLVGCSFIFFLAAGSTPLKWNRYAVCMLFCFFGVSLKLSALLLPAAYVLILVSRRMHPRELVPALSLTVAAGLLGAGCYLAAQPHPMGVLPDSAAGNIAADFAGTTADRMGNLFRSYTQVFFRAVGVGDMVSEGSRTLLLLWFMSSLAFLVPFLAGILSSMRLTPLRPSLVVLVLAALLIAGWSWVIGSPFFYMRIALPVLPSVSPLFGIGLLGMTALVSRLGLGRLAEPMLVCVLLLGSAVLVGALALDARRTREASLECWEALESCQDIVPSQDVVLAPDEFTEWRMWHMRRPMTYIGPPVGRLTLDDLNLSDPLGVSRVLRKAGIEWIWIDSWPETSPQTRALYRSRSFPSELEAVILDNPTVFSIEKNFTRAGAYLVSLTGAGLLLQ